MSGVGALTISICRRVCHGVRGGHGGWSWLRSSLALGTSCGKSSNTMHKMCSIKENTRIIDVDIILH